jgi:hypothetical protein
VLIADIIGVMGGFLVGVYKLDFNDATYLRNTIDFLQFQDVFSGLVKAAVFGFLITLMGCYHGYTSKGGAQGVGLATTNAVVSASILILTGQLLHHRSLLRAVNPAPKISLRGVTKAFGRQAGAARHRPRRRGRRIGGGDRRFGQRQVGAAEVHPRA